MRYEDTFTIIDFLVSQYKEGAPCSSTSVATAMSRLLRLACLPAAMVALAGCNDDRAATVKPVTFVRTEATRMQARQVSVALTGDIQPKVRTELSFRVSGRVTERLVDVGLHVNAGEVLARIDPVEQQADLDGANAAVAAAESQLRVATATFDRQQALLTGGFTTRASFDQAQQGLRTAEGSLESAKAQLGTAKDALTYTELRASAAGVITARNLEVGQVAQAAQSAFTLAQDGPRDAVFDVYESVLFRQPESNVVHLSLVADPAVTATGHVREVAPTVDPKTATVRVKVAIDQTPAAMTLGSVVTGEGRGSPAQRIILPWSAMTVSGNSPAVWVVDPASKTVSLKAVVVESYEKQVFVVRSGLEPGERVVTEGGKMLRPGQAVTFDGEGA
jgi:RND family efflux transporter MFP subunit